MIGLHLQIPNKLDQDLSYLAKEQEMSKSQLVRVAIETYIQELKEDIEDYHDAMKSLKEGGPTISWEEVKKENGLLD